METTLAEFITVGLLLVVGAGLGLIGGWLFAVRFREPPPPPPRPPAARRWPPGWPG